MLGINTSEDVLRFYVITSPMGSETFAKMLMFNGLSLTLPCYKKYSEFTKKKV